MRSKKAIVNIIVSLIYELFLIVMGLIVPKLIINTYGSEINGLTSTINSVLTILNLLQAGAVGASIFQMFKPVAEKDYETQGKILGSSRLYFCKIGIIFVALVVVAAPVLAFAMVSGEIGIWDKIIAFLLLGINGSLSFFFISNYDILFSSNQKRFIISLASLIERIVYYGLLLTIIFLRVNFLLMYAITIISTSLKIVFLYLVYRNTYKNLIKYTYNKSYKIPNKGYLMCNQIARQTVDGTPTIIISMVSGLGISSVFSVYNLVFNMLKTLSTTIQTSISEIFGNVVVSESEEKVKRVYDLIGYVFFVMSIILCGCAAFLYLPFIYVYTGGNSLDINYMYHLPTILFVIYGVIYINYHPVYTLTNVLGLYKETYLQSIITAIVSVGIAIGLSFIDWSLVIVGIIFYYLVSLIYRTYIVKKKTGDEYLSVVRSVSRISVSLCLTTGLWLMSYFLISSYIASWIWWFILACCTGIGVLIVVLVYSLLFERKQLKMVYNYCKSILRRKHENTVDRS